ncbi:MFS-type transporter 1 [Cladobotryum mycophilum]|uniref:MFS-type transporter 1 n=1 Tax=Cladobotryum mycophilum TaxID=491253 RepID=A0ABR0SCV9_9HYPO
MALLTADGKHGYETNQQGLLDTPSSPVDSGSVIPVNDSPELTDLTDDEPLKPSGLSLLQTCVVIFGLSGVAFCNSMTAGLLTVGLPVIAEDLDLPEHLLLWPSSAYALACGCCLLLAGSIADRVGDRAVNLVGAVLMAASIAGTSVSKTGAQLIAFRVLQGIAVSMCLPTGVSILTRSLPPGRARNIGFSCLGTTQPLGFSVGLVMEGALEELGQWRYGYYISTAILGFFIVANWINLPADVRPFELSSFSSLATDIDWIGVLIASTGLGLISYTCAVLSQNVRLLLHGGNMAALILPFVFIPAFFWWTKRQEDLGKPALISTSIWKNSIFLVISFTVFLTWGSFQSSILMMSLFFQKVQQVAPMAASVRLIPNVVVGVILNPITGLFVQRVKCYKLLTGTALVAAISPLLMALINPAWSWWICAFWAVALGPVCVNVLFTLAHIIITDIFPSEMHALAGAVFQTMSQLGSSLGVSIIAIIFSSVTRASKIQDKTSPEALMVGYRASFWACFAMMIVCAISAGGLRSLGKLGAAVAK